MDVLCWNCGENLVEMPGTQCESCRLLSHARTTAVDSEEIQAERLIEDGAVDVPIEVQDLLEEWTHDDQLDDVEEGDEEEDD